MTQRTRKRGGPASERKRSPERPDPPPEAPKATDEAADERDEPGKSALFPIVGIGASAGGLEAFTQLLGALPLDTGLGFVLVQHLDPEHESALVQILARATALPVQEVKNHEPVQPNHIYVIPRDTSLSIREGILKLEPRPRSRAPHRPIDSFFESLAQDQGARAVGVVLSGTATDGTLGLEAIKAEGGITFAQDDSARYDSMPRSAVAAGCVDLVLSPADIASELARIAKHPYVVQQPPAGPADSDPAVATLHEDDETPLPSGDRGSAEQAEKVRAEAGDGGSKSTTADRAGNGYKKILLLLRNHSGVDFSLYKSTTIQRRINRRLVLNKQNALEDYAGFLRGNTKELDALYSDVLISVTSFFRNPEVFDALKQNVLPELLERRGDDPLRCWVLGCSTGQEAYSVAIAFSEAVERSPRMRTLQVFATDINDALLDKARHGLYAKSLVEDITPERLRRFFIEEGGGYRVSKALREMVVFARQNLISDPPFSRMDLITCRNLLIYLEPSLQQKALPTFHYALKPGGFLVLGASESIGNFTDLFAPVDKKHKIYAKKAALTPAFHLPLKKEHGGEPPRVRAPHPMPQPTTLELPGGPRGELNAQREADRITVHRFAPPAVLVNADLQVLQFRGPTGAFLQPPTGRASFDVLKMARKGLMLPLRSAINQAKKENKTARKENVRVQRDGKARTVNLEVIPLKNLPERCFLILFEEARASGEAEGRRSSTAEVEPDDEAVPLPAAEEPGRINEIETELAETREYLQAMQEQHEAAHEELQAANEEVQSANEELQSLNEELETSKEELESANEELTTVNEEMSNRNVELNRLNSDLLNLQTSTQIALLLLGRDLVIRRFSPQAEKQFDLLLTDLGRPLSNIRHNLVLGDAAGTPLDLEGLSTEVVSTVREQEREVRDKSGCWYSLRVRPYMTLDNKVDGAVLVLHDIDAIKRSEETLRAARDFAESTVETVPEPLLILDGELRIESANRAFFRIFRAAPGETIGRPLDELGNRQWNIPRLLAPLRHILAEGGSVEDFLVEHDFAELGRRVMLVNARRIHDGKQKSQRILLAVEDITERKRAERASSHLAAIVKSSDDAIISTDLDGTITTWNNGAARLFGYGAEEAIGKPVAMLLPPDRADEEPGLVKRIQHGEAIEHYETVRQRKDGSLLDVSLTISPIHDAAGRVIGASKIARDVTERKRLESELRRYSQELSEADQRKNEFLAMLGHELRNPVSALMHAIALQAKTPDNRGRSEELRRMMSRQTGRIVSLLDQLLDVSRVISGKIEISKDRVDLAEVVRTGVETVRPLVETHKHELTVTLPADAKVFVTGDAIRLTQVVENLLGNAIKYTKEGGQIRVALETDQNECRVIVRDTGLGISADFVPHIFEVFTQAPRTLHRAQGGLGLGLPLVRRLVELHEGRVSASSPGLGQGSEFVVTLPLPREPRSKEGRNGASVPTEPGTIRPFRILIVDDERDIAEAIAALLEDDGHRTLAASDGPAALAAVDTFDPEVVLLDLGLPEMDGYEVAKRLREEHAGKRIFLIAVSGYQNDAVRLKEAGFDHHLLKPPDLRELSALLAAWDRGEGRPHD